LVLIVMVYLGAHGQVRDLHTTLGPFALGRCGQRGARGIVSFVQPQADILAKIRAT